MSNFKVGDVVKTLDGREVEILKTDLDSYTPIVGVIHLAPHGGKIVKQWKADGSIFDGPTDWSLIPPKRTREGCSLSQHPVDVSSAALEDRVKELERLCEHFKSALGDGR